MPTSTIPYDPSLVLGMIVEPEKIKQLEDIADKQKPANAARDKFNALLRQKLSLDMTKRELVSLGAQPKQLEQLQKQITKLKDDVVKASGDLASEIAGAPPTSHTMSGTTARHHVFEFILEIASDLDQPASCRICATSATGR